MTGQVCALIKVLFPCLLCDWSFYALKIPAATNWQLLKTAHLLLAIIKRIPSFTAFDLCALATSVKRAGLTRKSGNQKKRRFTSSCQRSIRLNRRSNETGLTLCIYFYRSKCGAPIIWNFHFPHFFARINFCFTFYPKFHLPSLIFIYLKIVMCVTRSNADNEKIFFCKKQMWLCRLEM